MCVGAAMDPLFDGMVQLNSVISFRDGGSGLARKPQDSASRGQAASLGAKPHAGLPQQLELEWTVLAPNVDQQHCKAAEQVFG